MRALATISIALIAACGGKTTAPAKVDISGLTQAPACFVVRAPDATVRTSDDTLCAKRLQPASTFKIPNALIGADVGLLDGPDAIMTYDARAYPKEDFWYEGWDKDQPLREAMRISAVPLFRKLAVDIGPERMKAHLDAFAYGNKDMSGGQDTFWLSGGGLLISAPEQVEFLTKLLAGTLPVTPRAMETARAALPTESSGDSVLHWKTGTLRQQADTWTAWLVGWVARPDGNHVFACWLEDVGDFDTVRERRMAFCKGVLARLGLFQPPPPSGTP